MGLQGFERRLERIVEGVFARVFRSGLQPVEIGRRLTREMDLRRTVTPRGRLTPNQFTVAISPEDRSRFSSIEEELVSELIAVAKEHAEAEKYHFLGPVTIEMETDGDLSPGMLLLVGDMLAGNPGAALVLPDGSKVKLADKTVVIGRMPECDVTAADPNVSRRHAEVRPAEDRSGYILADLGSTNGTRLNGTSVRSAKLSPGDEIGVGSTRIRFEAS
jgi:hypothetical protein